MSTVASSDAVCIFDIQLRPVFVNEAAEQVLCQPLLAERCRRDAAQALAGGVPVHADVVLEDVGPGGERHYQYTIAPVASAACIVDRVVLVGRDVTEVVLAGRRATQLQALTARVASALSSAEVADAIVGHAHECVGASATVAYFVDRDPDTMRLVAARGTASEALLDHQTMRLDESLPLAVALRQRAPVWIESYPDFRTAYPDLIARTPADRLQSIVALPLLIEGRVVGGLAFSFAQPGRFDQATRQFMVSVAERCAEAAERARLLEQERVAERRRNVLSNASQRFSEARLDLEAVAGAVCREIVAQLADGCAITMVGEGELRLIGYHDADPVAEADARALLARTPVRVGDASIPGQVAASGLAFFVPRMHQASLIEGSRGEYRPHLEKYPIGSLLVLPLRSAEATIGTVTVIRRPARPPFDDDDRALLQSIAERAGLAVDNARLFAAELRSNQLLQQAVRLRDDFLATASHELRTPVTALLLHLQTMLGQQRRLPAGEASPRLHDHLARAESQVQRLTWLIDQLLDVSLITAGRMTLQREPVALAEVIEDVTERFEHKRARLGSSLEVWAPTPIVGMWDRLRLDQIMTNLVSNALKYGAGRPVRIEASSDGEMATLIVSDRGIGIAREHHERIFGRFERAVSQGHYGGLGLGLWITRQLVEQMGGSITFESSVASGTTFTVRLPLAA